MKFIVLFFITVFILWNQNLLWAKVVDAQDQIILLNDSAAALEDSNPELSKRLTALADEREKEWEIQNANKSDSPTPVPDEPKPALLEHEKLLQAAALAIQPTYPLIAKSLNQMMMDLDGKIKNEK